MKQVAIYLTNTDDSAFAARWPDDAEKVIAGLRAVGADYAFSVFDVTKGTFPNDPTSFDAVILTGSPAYVDDDEGWIARMLDDIRTIAAARVPMIGLCFGHQAIIAALGGKISKRDFWIFGAAEFTVAEHRDWMEPACGSMRLYAANLAQADAVPDGMQVLAGSPDCPIAMTCMGQHVFTTQFHPEMTDSFIADLVEEYAADLGDETATKSRGGLAGGADGPVFLSWVRNFIDLPRG